MHQVQGTRSVIEGKSAWHRSRMATRSRAMADNAICNLKRKQLPELTRWTRCTEFAAEGYTHTSSASARGAA
jgi:hypothetical protein